MNKIILTDCDGVLLNWEYAFDIWMQEHGNICVNRHEYDIALRYGIKKIEAKSYVKLFNESAAIGFLPALRDAVHYVRKLYEERGYRFRVITSLSLDPSAKKLRSHNLAHLFGDAIEEIICLGCGADKNFALEPYRDSNMLWIEDKEENAELGWELGLDAILVLHEHNRENDVVPVMQNWKEIYEYILMKEEL